MEWWLIVIISVLGFSAISLVAYYFGISALMAKQMCRPKHYLSREEKMKQFEEEKVVEGIKEYQRIPIEFKMKDGYIIHGDYSLNNPKKFVICMHGHRSLRDSSIKYVYAFYRLGYSLVFYDHRSHGDNERDYVTMGYREHQDALEVIEQVREKFGKDIELGLFGCSMGGTTALMCLKEHDDLSFVVADSPFASLKHLVSGFCVQHKSRPLIFLWCTNLFLKKKYHFSMKDVCPLDVVKVNKKVPILYIHGKEDGFVFPENSKELYENTVAPKRLEIFEGANHCGAVTVDRNRYYKVIEEFIKEHK